MSTYGRNIMTGPLAMVTTCYDRLRGLYPPKTMVEQLYHAGFRVLALADTDSLSGAIDFTREVVAVGGVPILGCRLSIQVPAPLLATSRQPIDTVYLLARTEQAWMQMVGLVARSQSWYQCQTGVGGVPSSDDEALPRPVSWEQIAEHGSELQILIGGTGSLLVSLFEHNDRNLLQTYLEFVLGLTVPGQVYGVVRPHLPATTATTNERLIYQMGLLQVPVMAIVEVGMEDESDHSVWRLAESAMTALQLTRPPIIKSLAKPAGTIMDVHEAQTMLPNLISAYEAVAEIIEPPPFRFLLGPTRTPFLNLQRGTSPESRLWTWAQEEAMRRGVIETISAKQRLYQEYQTLVNTPWVEVMNLVAELVKTFQTEPGLMSINHPVLYRSFMAWLLGISSFNPLEHGVDWHPPDPPEGSPGVTIELQLPSRLLQPALEQMKLTYRAEHIVTLLDESTPDTHEFEAWWQESVESFPEACLSDPERVRRLVLSRLRSWVFPKPQNAQHRPYRIALSRQPWWQVWPLVESPEHAVSLHGLALSSRAIRHAGYLEVQLTTPLENDLWCVGVPSPTPRKQRVQKRGGILARFFKSWTALKRRPLLSGFQPEVFQHLGASIEENWCLAPHSNFLGWPVSWQLARWWKPERLEDVAYLFGVLIRLQRHHEELSGWLESTLAVQPVLEVEQDSIPENWWTVLEQVTAPSGGVFVALEQMEAWLEQVTGCSPAQAHQICELEQSRHRRIERTVAGIVEMIDCSTSQAHAIAAFLRQRLPLPDWVFLLRTAAQLYYVARAQAFQPLEFYGLLLTTNEIPVHMLAMVCQLFRQAGGRVELPHIHSSTKTPICHSNSVRLGLQNIHGIGPKAAEELIRARAIFQSQGQPGFNGLAQLCESTSPRLVHRGILLNLVLSGACRCFNTKTSALLDELESLLSDRHQDPVVQPTLFDLGASDDETHTWLTEWRQRLAELEHIHTVNPSELTNILEGDLLGMWITASPLDVFTPILAGIKTWPSIRLSNPGQEVLSYGLLTQGCDASVAGCCHKAFQSSLEPLSAQRGPWLASLWQDRYRIICVDPTGCWLPSLSAECLREPTRSLPVLMMGKAYPAEYPQWGPMLHITGIQRLPEVRKESESRRVIRVEVDPESVDWLRLWDRVRLFSGNRWPTQNPAVVELIPQLVSNHPRYVHWHQCHQTRVLPCELFVAALKKTSGVLNISVVSI